MAGSPALTETVNRGGLIGRQRISEYSYGPSSDTPVPACVPRSENSDPPQRIEKEELEQKNATSQPEIDNAADDRTEEQQRNFHRSKVVEGLSRGEWDEAEDHLSQLLKDFAITESPDVMVLQAMAYNSKAKWREAMDLLKDFKHQSTSEPELSARAYYAKAIALYKLKDYGICHMNCRRGLAVVDKFLTGDIQAKYRSDFGDLASRCLEDLGNKIDTEKAKHYKSLISPSHTSDPILLVTTISQSTTTTPERSEAERAQLLEDMKSHRLSFGCDEKILVAQPKNLFLALDAALRTDNLPLMTLICSHEWCAKEELRESPIYFDLGLPMPQYAWRGTTLLHVVAGSHSKYSAPMAQLLLDNGANPQRTLFEGITPLHVCARQTNVEVASVLIKNGANIEARSITGKPPIHFAAWKASWNADVRILKMLIAAGANINAKNSGGYTALHWCMFDGRSAAPIEVLLERPEIDKFARATNHKTPWDIFWEHEAEFSEKGEEKRTQILYTLMRYGINR